MDMVNVPVGAGQLMNISEAPLLCARTKERGCGAVQWW